MPHIVANILSLAQHLSILNTNPKKYYINQCPCCGKLGLRGHGYRYRKSDRENNGSANLNPIPIRRLYCPTCKRTCSILPECIPPLRWYLWRIQQITIALYFSGESFNKISQKVLPSRWTISRWVKRLKNQFELHALHLKSKWTWLGYKISLSELWMDLFKKINFSYAMLFLNSQGVLVP